MIVFLNNEFIDDKKAHLSISDAGLLYGHGVYESFRSFNGKLRLLDRHLERLEQSARAFYIPFSWDHKHLQLKIAELLIRRQAEQPDCDFGFRITLTAGTGNIRTTDAGIPTLIITANALDTTPHMPLILKSFTLVRQQPEVKSTAMLPAILGENYASQHGADEALLVDEKDIVHECSFSNILMVKDGTLKYPDTGALKGVTQNLLLDLARNTILITKATLTLKDFYEADEVFTTGAIRGILPVCKIDAQDFKAPGATTQKIIKLYDKWAKSK